jgi:hypothetical protein
MARITGLNQCSPLPLVLGMEFPCRQSSIHSANSRFGGFLAQVIVRMRANFSGRATNEPYVLCLL